MMSEKDRTNDVQDGQNGETISTKTCKVWLGDDGIVISVMHPGAEDNLETAKENIAAGIKVSGGVKRPLLLDMSRIKTMDHAARDYYAHNERREGSERAVALVVKSPLSRMFGNFFLGLNKPVVPTKLFNDQGKALDWLKHFSGE
ncbi:hypothetical protein ACFLRB_05970 [Acidobacteriota bacterium]